MEIKDPYSYADNSVTTNSSVVSPNLPLSIPSLPSNLQTLNSAGPSSIEDINSSSFNIVGKNNRITGFFTDTSYY